MTRQTVSIVVTTESEPERVADVAILTLGRQDVHAGCRKTINKQQVTRHPVYNLTISMQDVHITEHIQHRK